VAELGNYVQREPCSILAPICAPQPAAGHGKDVAITTLIDRQGQGDLLVGLSHLVQRNRLALVVLAANLAVMGGRARNAAVDTAALRWLARNAQALLEFLRSFSILQRCAGQAGYRVIQARRRPIRRRRAPRILRHRLDRRNILPTSRSTGLLREGPRFDVNLE
jgi:hypothetical protein